MTQQNFNTPKNKTQSNHCFTYNRYQESIQLKQFLKRKRKVLPRPDPVQSEIFINYDNTQQYIETMKTTYSREYRSSVKITHENMRNKLMSKYGVNQNVVIPQFIPKVKKPYSRKRQSNLYTLSNRNEKLPELILNKSHQSSSIKEPPRKKKLYTDLQNQRDYQQDAQDMKTYSIKKSNRYQSNKVNKPMSINITKPKSYIPQRSKTQRKQYVENQNSIQKQQKPKNKKKNNRSWVEINPLTIETFFVKLRKTNSQKSMFNTKKQTYKITIPNNNETAQYIQKYTPMNKMLSIDQLVRSPNFNIKRDDNSLYIGEMVEDNFEGLGILVKDKYIYQGTWVNNMRKQGYEKTQVGIFKGKFLNNKREGTAEFFWTNGQYYNGQWNKGLKHGNGFWKSKEGDMYLGQWKNGKVEGNGVHTTAKGIISNQIQVNDIKVVFKDFLKQGKGKQQFPNGDIYIGEYQKGFPHGKGKYIWKFGLTYEGNFQNGYRSGEGKLQSISGLRFKGNYLNELPNGFGLLNLTNGDIYKGEFKDGKKQGDGIYTAVSQHKIYEGQFINDKFDGKQTLPLY